MKGEISYDFFSDQWIKEESHINSELKGFEYLCTVAHNLSPTFQTDKRGMVSSQRIEMRNNLMKKNGNSAYEMLRQFFNISTSWFEKSATITYPSNRFLTNYAENILNEIIKVEFTCEKLNETLHFKKSDTECGCYIGHDLGIPCPYTIRLIRFNEIKNKNDNENFNLLEMPLFNNEKLLKLISPEWRISTMKKTFSPLINRQNTEFKIIPFKQDDILNDEKPDILAAKIIWLYSNSLVYKGKVDKLLKEAQEEIVFPFFEIKKPKEKNKKRHMSSLEINKKEMENDEVMEALSKHLSGEKNYKG